MNRQDRPLMDVRYEHIYENFDRYLELLNALSGRYTKWSNPRARKEHRCEFGCLIQPGEKYYRKLWGPSRSDDPKLCRDCMAKVLFLLLRTDPDMAKCAQAREKEAWEVTMRAFHSLREPRPQGR